MKIFLLNLLLFALLAQNKIIQCGSSVDCVMKNLGSQGYIDIGTNSSFCIDLPIEEHFKCCWSEQTSALEITHKCMPVYQTEEAINSYIIEYQKLGIDLKLDCSSYIKSLSLFLIVIIILGLY